MANKSLSQRLAKVEPDTVAYQLGHDMEVGVATARSREQCLAEIRGSVRTGVAMLAAPALTHMAGDRGQETESDSKAS